ncbi:MAG: LptF/LptG family permease [Myxococcota bacterium]|nr:LptF/LptG family permease [Myxococcota bacterium]
MVLAVALAAQLVKVYKLVGQNIDPLALMSLMGKALFILLEMVVPISVLVGTVLLFGRLRTHQVPLALATLGHAPHQMLRPMLPWVIFLALLSGWLTADPIPSTIESLGHDLHRSVVQSSLSHDGVIRLDKLEVITSTTGDGDRRHWMTMVRDHGPALIIFGENLYLTVEQEAWRMRVESLMMWPDQFRIRAPVAQFKFAPPNLPDHLRMFGPPNARVSHRLDVTHPHHQFTYHRRIAFSVIIIPWFILGALGAIRFQGPVIGLMCCGLLGVSYWLLRSGELAARAFQYSPVLAAWGPVILACAMVPICWVSLRRGAFQ